MKKKSIFKASFEESLNLENDIFKKNRDKTKDDLERYFQNGGTSLRLTISYFLLSLFFPIGVNFVFSAMIRWGQIDEPHRAYRIWKIDVHPRTIFWVGFSIWLLLILIGKFYKQTFILPYRIQFHIQVSSMIWTVVECNLLLIPLFQPTLTSYGIFAMIGLIIILILAMLRSNLKSLRATLYNEDIVPNLLDKIVKFLSVYGLGILGIGVIVKVLISLFSVRITDSMEFYGLVIAWIVFNIGYMALLIYSTLPKLLQGYYKLKYPEDYRLWEGKTVEEWYGKKYLKKHMEEIYVQKTNHSDIEEKR